MRRMLWMTPSDKCLSRSWKRVPWTGQPLKVDLHECGCVYTSCVCTCMQTWVHACLYASMSATWVCYRCVYSCVCTLCVYMCCMCACACPLPFIQNVILWPHLLSKCECQHNQSVHVLINLQIYLEQNINCPMSVYCQYTVLSVCGSCVSHAMYSTVSFCSYTYPSTPPPPRPHTCTHTYVDPLCCSCVYCVMYSTLSIGSYA